MQYVTYLVMLMVGLQLAYLPAVCLEPRNEDFAIATLFCVCFVIPISARDHAGHHHGHEAERHHHADHDLGWHHHREHFNPTIQKNYYGGSGSSATGSGPIDLGNGYQPNQYLEELKRENYKNIGK